MLVNADLHIHSKYSMATAKSMTLENIANGAKQKGVQLMGTGDCLHPKWLNSISSLDEVAQGTYQLNGIRFVLTTEVEDMFRVHHLIIFPDIQSAEKMAKSVGKKSKNLTSDGRPKLRMTGEEIAEEAEKVNALIGPCHAFTPYTALYAYHDSLRNSYGNMEHYISFVELGLSAESDYADRISELRRLTFLTNSDAHGPAANRVAREFNRFEMEENCYEELKLAILRKNGRKPVLNLGLPPQEGKYNRTACVKCYERYSLEQAVRNNWKCVNCGKRIKKGVRERVEELSDSEKPAPPSHRPPYKRVIPLADIIARVIRQGVNTKGVKRIWQNLLNKFETEINVLIDTPLNELKENSEEDVFKAVKAFRNDEVRFIPGGGGKYGEIRLPWEELEEIEKTPKQKGLGDFI